MKEYDTLLIGAGYSSFGYAAARGRCLVVEEQEIADTHFYLPLRSFCHTPYTPSTAEGRRLEEHFRALGLFRDGRQNVNGFEVALCRYLTENPLSLLLKTRVVRQCREGERTVVALIGNGGLSEVACRRVIDTHAGKGERLTVLLTASSRAEAEGAARQCGFSVTDAFYPGQYALFAPFTGEINETKLAVAEALRGCPGIRILAMAQAPAAAGEGALLSDDDHENPIAAFEAGYLLGKEVAP